MLREENEWKKAGGRPRQKWLAAVMCDMWELLVGVSNGGSGQVCRPQVVESVVGQEEGEE